MDMEAEDAEVMDRIENWTVEFIGCRYPAGASALDVLSHIGGSQKWKKSVNKVLYDRLQKKGLAVVVDGTPPQWVATPACLDLLLECGVQVPFKRNPSGRPASGAPTSPITCCTRPGASTIGQHYFQTEHTPCSLGEAASFQEHSVVTCQNQGYDKYICESQGCESCVYGYQPFDRNASEWGSYSKDLYEDGGYDVRLCGSQGCDRDACGDQACDKNTSEDQRHGRAMYEHQERNGDTDEAKVQNEVAQDVRALEEVTCRKDFASQGGSYDHIGTTFAGQPVAGSYIGNCAVEAAAGDALIDSRENKGIGVCGKATCDTWGEVQDLQLMQKDGEGLGDGSCPDLPTESVKPKISALETEAAQLATPASGNRSGNSNDYSEAGTSTVMAHRNRSLNADDSTACFHASGSGVGVQDGMTCPRVSFDPRGEHRLGLHPWEAPRNSEGEGFSKIAFEEKPFFRIQVPASTADRMPGNGHQARSVRHSTHQVCGPVPVPLQEIKLGITAVHTVRRDAQDKPHVVRSTYQAKLGAETDQGTLEDELGADVTYSGQGQPFSTVALSTTNGHLGIISVAQQTLICTMQLVNMALKELSQDDRHRGQLPTCRLPHGLSPDAPLALAQAQDQLNEAFARLSVMDSGTSLHHISAPGEMTPCAPVASACGQGNGTTGVPNFIGIPDMDKQPTAVHTSSVAGHCASANGSNYGAFTRDANGTFSHTIPWTSNTNGSMVSTGTLNNMVAEALTMDATAIGAEASSRQAAMAPKSCPAPVCGLSPPSTHNMPPGHIPNWQSLAESAWTVQESSSTHVFCQGHPQSSNLELPCIENSLEPGVSPMGSFAAAMERQHVVGNVAASSSAGVPALGQDAVAMETRQVTEGRQPTSSTGVWVEGHGALGSVRIAVDPQFATGTPAAQLQPPVTPTGVSGEPGDQVVSQSVLWVLRQLAPGHAWTAKQIAKQLGVKPKQTNRVLYHDLSKNGLVEILKTADAAAPLWRVPIQSYATG
eukprot:evm.model.scf_21EXC.22 EVM.evm.TU.scf_21EXC.22   scf_21EXC:207545-213420(-)